MLKVRKNYHSNDNQVLRSYIKIVINSQKLLQTEKRQKKFLLLQMLPWHWKGIDQSESIYQRILQDGKLQI